MVSSVKKSVMGIPNLPLQIITDVKLPLKIPYGNYYKKFIMVTWNDNVWTKMNYSNIVPL